MKHCKFCNCDVEDKKVHCPLCSKCLDETKVKAGMSNKSAIYPNYTKVKPDMTKTIVRTLTNSLLILTIICFAIDLMLNYKVTFSLIVGIGFLLAYFAILRPIKKYMSLENVIITLSIFVPPFLLFIELYTHTFGWGVNIAVPALLFGLSLASFIFMLIKGYMDGDMLKPIVVNVLLNALLLLLLFLFKQYTLISIIAFWANVAMILFTLVFKFKFASKSITKQFRI